MRRLVVVAGVFLSVGFAAGLVVSGLVVQAAADGKGAGVPSGNGDVNGDGTIDVSDVVCTCRWLFLDGEAPVPIVCPPTGLPATGQTKCYGDGRKEIPCETSGYRGEDGFYQAGCPTQGRFVDNMDGTVTDNCTGLMWQKEVPPLGYKWIDAIAHCQSLDLAGYGDWRLPNVRELQSIVDYGRWDPAIDPVFGGTASRFWSSSSFAPKPIYAWMVDTIVGYVFIDYDDRDLSYAVRAVRNARLAHGPHDLVGRAASCLWSLACRETGVDVVTQGTRRQGLRSPGQNQPSGRNGAAAGASRAASGRDPVGTELDSSMAGPDHRGHEARLLRTPA